MLAQIKKTDAIVNDPNQNFTANLPNLYLEEMEADDVENFMNSFVSAALQVAGPGSRRLLSLPEPQTIASATTAWKQNGRRLLGGSPPPPPPPVPPTPAPKDTLDLQHSIESFAEFTKAKISAMTQYAQQYHNLQSTIDQQKMMQVREQRMHSVLADAAQANSVTDEQIKLLTAKQTRAVKRATTFLFQQQRQLDDFTLVDNPEISSKQLIESVQPTPAGLMLARSNVYDAYKSMTAPGVTSTCSFSLTLDGSSPEVEALRVNGTAAVHVMPPFRQWVNVTKAQYTFDNATNQSVAWNETIAQRLGQVLSSAYGVTLSGVATTLTGIQTGPGVTTIRVTKTGQDIFLKQNGQDYKKTYHAAILYDYTYDTRTQCPTSSPGETLIGGEKASQIVMLSPYGVWTVLPELDQTVLKQVTGLKMIFSVSYQTQTSSDHHPFFCNRRDGIGDCQCGAIQPPAGCYGFDSQSCMRYTPPPPSNANSESGWKIATIFMFGLVGVLAIVALHYACKMHKNTREDGKWGGWPLRTEDSLWSAGAGVAEEGGGSYVRYEGMAQSGSQDPRKLSCNQAPMPPAPRSPRGSNGNPVKSP